MYLFIHIIEPHKNKTLRKHAYSNILKISPPKTESFQIKILIFIKFMLKKYIVGTRYNRLAEVVLTSSHNLGFWIEIRKIMFTPVNPQFYYIKVGFKWIKII